MSNACWGPCHFWQHNAPAAAFSDALRSRTVPHHETRGCGVPDWPSLHDGALPECGDLPEPTLGCILWCCSRPGPTQPCGSAPLLPNQELLCRPTCPPPLSAWDPGAARTPSGPFSRLPWHSAPARSALHARLLAPRACSCYNVLQQGLAHASAPAVGRPDLFRRELPRAGGPRTPVALRAGVRGRWTLERGRAAACTAARARVEPAPQGSARHRCLAAECRRRPAPP